MNKEFYRLQAVERFKHLDNSITADLNDIVNLAAEICNTPAALVTLLDEDTQWFKASTGVEITHTAREVSFCNNTIEQNNICIVNNALADERYKDNKLVTEDMNLRFYAGVPLTTNDGYSIGTLCVIDFKPGELNPHQQKSLQVLSKQVMNLMELSWSLKVFAAKNEENKENKKGLEDSEIKLKAVFDSSTDIHILVNRDMQITAFNAPAADYFFNIYQHDIALGDILTDYIDPYVKNKFVKHIAVSMRGKMTRHDLFLRAGTEFESWREVKFVPIRNYSGEIIGVAINSADITKRKQQEKQITIQNEALTRIAIIQSHELRRPVASLMGLMNLMKIDDIDFDYFNMMELTVQELDEKIRLIVADSEKTITSPMYVVA
jgi:PAS domain S-box-containing protein